MVFSFFWLAIYFLIFFDYSCSLFYLGTEGPSSGVAVKALRSTKTLKNSGSTDISRNSKRDSKRDSSEIKSRDDKSSANSRRDSTEIKSREEKPDLTCS